MQPQFNSENYKNPQGGVDMCKIINKNQETALNKSRNSLQTEYERIISNHSANPNNKNMCTYAKEKPKNSSIDSYDIPQKNISQNITVQNNAANSRIYNAPASHQTSSTYISNDIIAKLKEFDEEEMDKKSSKSQNNSPQKINKALSLLNKPQKISQYEIMQKFIKCVPVITNQGKVFIYNGIFYEMAKPDLVKQKIVELFRMDLKDKTASFVNGIYHFLKIEPTIAVPTDSIRHDLLTFNNLILDLTTGETYDLSPQFITTYQIRANYLPNTHNFLPPHFSKFINRITGNDPLMARRCSEIIGYCMTADVSAKVLFLYQGLGDTGKSILARIMQMLLTPEVVYPLKAENLRKPFAMAELYNRILSVCNDLSAESLDDKTTGTLKELTGRDLISSSVKYSEDIVFTNHSKILIVTNHVLKTKTPDKAFFRRVVCVPFNFPVPTEEIDINLLSKLWDERDYIATTAITAYWQLKNRNYVFSGNYEPNLVVVQDESSEIDVETIISKYLIDNFEPSNGTLVFIDDIYNDFIKVHSGISLNVFSPYFKTLAFEVFGAEEHRKRKQKGGNAQHCLEGIKFKNYNI